MSTLFCRTEHVHVVVLEVLRRFFGELSCEEYREYCPARNVMSFLRLTVRVHRSATFGARQSQQKLI